MNWKPKYYLIFPRKVIHEIKWPSNWGNQCSANLSEMLREQLKIKRGIGSEIKLIWNDDHLRQIIKDNNVTPSDIEDYIKADCTMLSFRTESLMNKSIKLLNQMGAVSPLIATDNYRDVILRQAEFYRDGDIVNVLARTLRKIK